MTPLARTYTGIMQIFSRGSTMFGSRGQHAVDFPIESDYVHDDFKTYIAGVNYKCVSSDIGGFIGMAVPVSNNPNDKNAVAIYRNDGKLLGYIPKNEAKEFREWSNGQTVPCVGYIKQGDGILNGRVKAIMPENEEAVKKTVAYYVRWLVENFGGGFIPKGFDIKDKGDGSDETLIEAINQYIEEEV